MTTEIILKYLVYGLIGLGGYIARSHAKRLEQAEIKINRLKVELAKNSQQNNELYNNVKRIDSNIDKLFNRIDDLIDAVRSIEKK